LKPYSGYLFDLDGTLVDTAPDINAALNHALGRHDLPGFPEHLTRHWIGHGARALIDQALAQRALADDAEATFVPRPTTESILEVFLAHYRQHIADLGGPYPGVVAALETLKARGARLAVVTNKLTMLTEPLLAALGLDVYFDAVVCGDTTAAPKPAADPALHACASLTLPPAATLFVGDSEADVRCARAAGCPVVVVRDGYNHGVPAAELGADAVIESFSDLV